MTESNRFAKSIPREDLPLCDGDTENNDLTCWNDTPPHENGEGPAANAFGRTVVRPVKTRPRRGEMAGPGRPVPDWGIWRPGLFSAAAMPGICLTNRTKCWIITLIRFL